MSDPEVGTTARSAQEAAAGYRADVDGLRAIAVVAVVLFHFCVEPFGAGFVGVDIFFVISGFLITRLIRKEIVEGRFTFTRFYIRRIKRIVPALLVVTVCSLAAGVVLLLPSDLEDLGRQAAYAVVGLSNFHFFFESGYFDRASEYLPLLHTWSLGVEEQFYLFWPALMILGAYLLKPRGRAPEVIIVPVVLGSLALTIFSVAEDQPFAFFMLPSRAWQLGLGGLLVGMPVLSARWQSESFRIVGIVLISIAILGIDPEAPYPGINALLPTIGAGLIIWPSAADSGVSRVLGLRPVVFLGLI